MQTEKQETLTAEEIKYLIFSKEIYEQQFTYDLNETPGKRIDKLQESKTNVEARGQLYRNTKRLKQDLQDYDEKIKDLDKSLLPDFDQVLIELVNDIAYDTANSIEDEQKRELALKFLKKLNDPGMLYTHLREAGDSIYAFFENIKEYVKGPDEILTERQIILLEFVGRTHDIGKLLGGLNAQIDPDHEVIYREDIAKHLEGKAFKGITFTKEDVEFIKAVAGFHEDIFREEEFAHQSTELEKVKGPLPPEVAVARARAILHFVDIFGNAVRFDQGKLKIVDENAFNVRFIDLYRRHINLPITHGSIDWSGAKVFRPEWGKHGVSGLTWTFGILEDEWGILLDPGLIPSVREGILRVLKEAEAAIVGLQKGDVGYSYTPPTGPTDIELSDKLDRIRLTLEAIEEEKK